jgi:hypothetical protein
LIERFRLWGWADLEFGLEQASATLILHECRAAITALKMETHQQPMAFFVQRIEFQSALQMENAHICRILRQCICAQIVIGVEQAGIQACVFALYWSLD